MALRDFFLSKWFIEHRNTEKLDYKYRGEICFEIIVKEKALWKKTTVRIFLMVLSMNIYI